VQVVFDSYGPDEPIPVQGHLRNRKLAKYFNRETAAALVAASKLLNGLDCDRRMPFYYETAVMEHEDLGLDLIAAASRDPQGHFSQELFITKGARAVPPITQFKALYNMPLAFIAIEHELTGDNAVIYASASGLLLLALNAPVETGILIGSGKVGPDGSVAAGFALIDKSEIADSPFLIRPGEAIHIFIAWQTAAGAR
jgi:hypothetical protein